MQAWAEYERVHLPLLAAKTQEGYGVCIRLALATLPPELDVGALVHWHRVTLLGERGLSARYANQSLRILRTITDRASLTTGDVELARLVRRVPAVREPVPSPRCPPDDVLSRVLPVARNPAERAWLLLAALGGYRRGELLGFRPEDYDRSSYVLACVRQRNSPLRKNRRPLYKRIDSPELRACLEWTIDHADEIRPRVGWHRGCSSGYLFPWSLKYLELFMERIRRHLGADAVRYMPRGWGWHQLRHWGASALEERHVLDYLGDQDERMKRVYRAPRADCSTVAMLDRHRLRIERECKSSSRQHRGGGHRDAGLTGSRGPDRPRGHRRKEPFHGSKPETPPRDPAT